MNLTFVETTGFTSVVQEYFGGDEGLRMFQSTLLQDPERGDLMPGCGGLRKVRQRDPRRGKGARGGLRIIYLYVPEARHVLLLDVYDKAEANDLTTQERKVLAALAARFREEIIHAYREKERR